MITKNVDASSQSDQIVRVRFTLDASSAETVKSLEVNNLREAVKRDMDMLSGHRFRSNTKKS